jgi:WD40 repeat protein
MHWPAERSTDLASVSFSPDGEFVAAGCGDGTVRVWQAATGEPTATLQGHTDAVRSVVFEESGRHLYSAGDRTLRGWHLSGPSPTPTFAYYGHRQAVLTLAYDAGAGRILSGGADGSVKVWDVAGPPAHQQIVAAGRWEDVIFTPDGKRLLALGGGGLTMWDLPGGGEVYRVNAGDSRLAMDSRGERLFAGGALLDVKTGARAGGGDFGRNGPYNSPAISPDGRRVAHQSNTWVLVRDTLTGQLWQIDTKSTVRDLAFSPDGKQILTGGGAGLHRDGKVHLWEVETGHEVRSFQGSRFIVWAVSFSADGRRVSAGGGDYQVGRAGEAKVWDASSGDELFAFDSAECVFRVDFSPDGSRLAIGGGRYRGEGPGTLTIRELTTGTEVLRLKTEWTVYGIAFDPTGRRLAVAGWGSQSPRNQTQVQGTGRSVKGGVHIWDGGRPTRRREPQGLLSTTQPTTRPTTPSTPTTRTAATRRAD